MFYVLLVKVLEPNYKKILFLNYFLFIVIGVLHLDRSTIYQKYILQKPKGKNKTVLINSIVDIFHFHFIGMDLNKFLSC